MMADLTTLFTPPAMLVTQHRLVLLLTACTTLGAAGAFLIARMPFRKHLLDAPNERSSHTVPTPRGGGVGILAAFIVAGLTLRIPMNFLLAGTLLSLVSFYGDYFRISITFRLAIQLISALMLLFPHFPGMMTHPVLPAFANLSPSMFFLILPLMLLFLIGTTNLYNFMDGINGLAGLSGTIGFGLLGCYTLYRSPAGPLEASFCLFCIAIALACLGFLPLNLPQSRVFMGDVGSILLGFVFAALVLTLSRNHLEMVCFAALFFPFFADGLTTMAIRLRDGENLAQSHRRHLYQLSANELGIAHWKISSLYGIVQLAVGLGVLFVYPCGIFAVMSFMTACIALFILMTVRIRMIVAKKEMQNLYHRK